LKELSVAKNKLKELHSVALRLCLVNGNLLGLAVHLCSDEIAIYVNILHSFLNLGEYRKDELLESAR